MADLSPIDSSSVVAGLDCGGTHTTCVVATLDGEALALGEGGPGNICTHPDTAPQAFQDALGMALRNAKKSREELAVVVLGCAGYFACNVPGGPEAAAQGLLPHGVTEIGSDIEIALAGAAPGEDAVVLIAGTGSVAYGGTQDGKRARAGGWGYLLSDEGSAFWIGLQAVRASLRAYDGRGPDTLLIPRLIVRLALSDVSELEGAVYGMDSINTEVAALASTVLLAAEEEDGVARSILDEGGRLLARMVLAVLERLDRRNSPISVATIGGVLGDPQSRIYRSLSRALREAAPGVALIAPRLPPVGGAVLRALAHRGLSPTPERLERLTESLARLMTAHDSD